MTKVICDICGKEIDKRAIHLHMRKHADEMQREAQKTEPPNTEGSNIPKRGLDVLNTWDWGYHALLPNLWCVINSNNETYITPVLALHINSDGGWIAICDREGKVRKVEDLNSECILCATRREAEKVVRILQRARGNSESIFGKFAKRFRERREKRKEERPVTVSKETMTQLISALREFSEKAKRGGEEEDELR